VPDPYEIDDEGRPVAEDHSEEEPQRVAGVEVPAATEPAPDPAAEEAAMRRQIETTLRFMRLQTAIGIVVLLALIAFLSDIRGVLILVLVIFAFSSLGAYWWLRRNLNARLKGPGAG
jgi:hypothetical protein